MSECARHHDTTQQPNVWMGYHHVQVCDGHIQAHRGSRFVYACDIAYDYYKEGQSDQRRCTTATPCYV